jgi:hypothetical protein
MVEIFISDWIIEIKKKKQQQQTKASTTQALVSLKKYIHVRMRSYTLIKTKIYAIIMHLSPIAEYFLYYIYFNNASFPTCLKLWLHKNSHS